MQASVVFHFFAVVCGVIAQAHGAERACVPMHKQPYAVFAFLGFACSDAGCARHKAGFAWADRAGINDERACIDAGGYAAFREGCRAFAADTVTAEQSGFEWARENEVTDTCLCRGAGPGFLAGCEAYVATAADWPAVKSGNGPGTAELPP
jgi:hypothetical protein